MPRVIVYNKTLLELREYLGNHSDHATKVFQASQNAFKAWWKDNNPRKTYYAPRAAERFGGWYPPKPHGYSSHKKCCFGGWLQWPWLG